MWEYRANVLKVIDGDTYLLDIDLGFDVHTRQHIRLKGAFCPELNQPKGKEAKRFVEQLITGRDDITVITEAVPPRSFERFVASVFVDGASLAELLINVGYANERQ